MALPQLRDQLLNEVPFDRVSSQLLVGRSITEWEVLFAESLKTSSLVWVKKEFNRLSGSEGKLSEFNDSVNDEGVFTHLSRLKEGMSRTFEIVHPSPFQKLSIADYVTDSDNCQEYLQKWEIIVKNRLLEGLDGCIAHNASWKGLAGDFGLPVEYLEEMLQHCNITYQKASSFIGREELVREVWNVLFSRNEGLISKTLSRLYHMVFPPFNDKAQTQPQQPTAQKMVNSRPKRSSVYSAITVAIIGESGTGKTALMSALAMLIMLQLINGGIKQPVITRYCGTSKFSLHGKDLIYSISLQLLAAYGEKEKLQQLLERMPHQKYEDAVAYFSSLLQRYPVILLIDSIDQLSNKDEARNKYDEVTQQWQYRYLCEQVIRNNHIPVVEMKHHSAEEATIRSILEKLLERRERKITDYQWSVVLKSASQEPNMLYLNLSLEIITKWRSWETEVELRPTVNGLINQIFNGLEIYYGKTLVCYAFGFVTFSRDGISDQEMKDCLSRQSEVFQEVCQYWQGVQTIPLHVWLRVKQAIKSLLVEKGQGCLKWYHRQLWEAAQERYVMMKKDCHSIMGRYFTEQLLCLTEFDVWHPDSKVNIRRAKEGYYHLYESGLSPEVITEMCSFEMVCASAICDDGYHFLKYLSKLHSQPEWKEHQLLDHYYRWIHRTLSIFLINPRRMISCTASEEPLVSIVKKENTKRFVEINLSTDPNCAYKSIKAVETLGSIQNFNSLKITLAGHKDMVFAISIHPDGSKIASGSSDKTIKIWDLLMGELLSTCEGHSREVTCLSWSPEGSKIVSGSVDKTIKIWDALTGELLNTWKGHWLVITTISWNPDGSVIASGSEDNSIKIWDAATGKLQITFSDHSDQVTSLAWNPEGSMLASGSFDKTIKIWHLLSGQLLQTLQGHEDKVTSVAWNPDGSMIASGSFDNTIKRWDVFDGKCESLANHGDKIASISWSKDGKKISSASIDKTMKIWHSVTGELLRILTGHVDAITSIAWSKDGNLVSGSYDHTVKIWDLSVGTLVNQSEGHEEVIVSLSWNPDGSKIASASWDKTLKIWDSVTREILRTLKGHDGFVVSVAWNRDDRTIASASHDKTIRIWDASTGELVRVLEGHSEAVISVCWNPDGSKIASGSVDKTIKIWDSLTGELLNTFKGHSNVIMSISWSPQGIKIVSGSGDKTIKIWDSYTEILLKTLKGHSREVTSVCWNHEGTKIASGSCDNTVKIWDVATGKSLTTLPGHADFVSSVIWNQDGTKIASGSFDMTIRIWDSSTGELRDVLVGHSANVTSISWKQDGSKIASGSSDRVIKLWNL